MKILFFGLIVSFVLSGCSKSVIADDNNSIPVDSTNTPFVEKAKAFIVSTREYDADSTGHIGCLNIFNSDGSTKWVKKNLGTGTPYPYYADGKLYVNTAVYYSSNSNYNELLALDFETGKQLWSFKDDYFSFNCTSKNGTIYVAGSGKNLLYALDGNSGNLIWSIYVKDLLPYIPVIDSNLIYVVSAPLTTAVYSITAIDINTHNIAWSKVIGVNPVSGVQILNNLLVYCNGAGAIAALNKSTGELVWQNSDRQYTLKQSNQNFIYGTSYQPLAGLYAFETATGKLKWKWESSSVTRFASFYQYDKNIYGFYFDINSAFRISFNKLTGDSLSTQSEPFLLNGYYSPIGSGNFLIGTYPNNHFTFDQFDPVTLNKQQTFNLPNTTVEMNGIAIITESNKIMY